MPKAADRRRPNVRYRDDVTCSQTSEMGREADISVDPVIDCHTFRPTPDTLRLSSRTVLNQVS